MNSDPTDSDRCLDEITAKFLRWKFECPDLYEQWMKEHTKTYETDFGKLTFIVTDLMPPDKIMFLP